MARKGRENAARGEGEHARVPNVVAGRNVIARLGKRRLFHVARGGECVIPNGLAPFDVAVAGLRVRWRDAESDEPSFARQARGNGHRVSEGTFVLDKMVGSEHQHDGVSSVARLYEQ